MWAVGPIVDTSTGEILAEAGTQIGDAITSIQASSLDSVEVIAEVSDLLLLNTIAEDGCDSHDEALMKIYARLRPGNPAQLEKAKTLFENFTTSTGTAWAQWAFPPESQVQSGCK